MVHRCAGVQVRRVRVARQGHGQVTRRFPQRRDRPVRQLRALIQHDLRKAFGDQFRIFGPGDHAVFQPDRHAAVSQLNAHVQPLGVLIGQRGHVMLDVTPVILRPARENLLVPTQIPCPAVGYLFRSTHHDRPVRCVRHRLHIVQRSAVVRHGDTDLIIACGQVHHQPRRRLIPPGQVKRSARRGVAFRSQPHTRARLDVARVAHATVEGKRLAHRHGDGRHTRLLVLSDRHRPVAVSMHSLPCLVRAASENDLERGRFDGIDALPPWRSLRVGRRRVGQSGRPMRRPLPTGGRRFTTDDGEQRQDPQCNCVPAHFHVLAVRLMPGVVLTGMLADHHVF